MRLSKTLYDQLASWAEDDFRSVNGQIEYLLTECVKQRKKNGKEDSLKVIEGLSKVDGGKLDADSITQNLNPEKKAAVEKIIKDSGLNDKNKFGDYKEYKKT